MRKVLAVVCLGVVAVLTVVLVRDLTGDEVVVRDPGSAGPVERAGLRVTCGGEPGWPPSVMADGVAGLLSEEDARRTFAAILADPGVGEEASMSLFPDGVDALAWRVLSGDEERLTLGLGHWTADGPARDAMVLSLEREEGRWVPGGWGSCRLSTVLPAGRSEVEVLRVVASADRTLTVRVHERQCTSARDPRSHLHEPEVVETDESVTIVWTSEPMKGGADCPGNPSAERTVELAEPLGDRAVLDGGVYPPRPVR